MNSNFEKVIADTISSKESSCFDKKKRINHEVKVLMELFSKAPKKDLTLLEPLIQNACFMKITLDDLQKVINEKGCCEEYKNGENQFGLKQSAELQAYNTTIKNYQIVMMKLLSVLPHPSECGMSLEEQMARLMAE